MLSLIVLVIKMMIRETSHGDLSRNSRTSKQKFADWKDNKLVPLERKAAKCKGITTASSSTMNTPSAPLHNASASKCG